VPAATYLLCGTVCCVATRAYLAGRRIRCDAVARLVCRCSVVFFVSRDGAGARAALGEEGVGCVLDLGTPLLTTTLAQRSRLRFGLCAARVCGNCEAERKFASALGVLGHREFGADHSLFSPANVGGNHPTSSVKWRRAQGTLP